MNRLVALLVLLMGLVGLVFGQDSPPNLKVELKSATAAPGQLVEGIATVTFGPNLHGYQNPQEDESIIPIVLSATGATLDKIEYPAGEKKIVGGLPDPYFVHSGTIQIPFSFKAPNDVPADGIKFTFSYQQCDDSQCFAPSQVEQAVALTVSGEAVETSPPPPAQVASTEAGGLGKFLQDSFANKNWVALGLVLILIGLAINLTPCVYPLIPVTISFFAGQAKEDGKGRAALAATYMFGIAISYGIVGAIAAVSGGVFGQLFQLAWFNIALGVFMIVLALSMFDLYQIGIPPALSKHLKGRSGPVGALLMGMLVGIGAAPCAGPIIVLLLTELTKVNIPTLSVVSFLLVGFGMGIPYFVLGLVSNPRSALPKAGGWMKSVKAIMGLAVIYFGIQYFIQAMPQLADPAVEPKIWIAFFLASALFLFWWDRKAADARTWNIKGAGILLAGILAGTAYSGMIAEQKLDATREEFKKLLGSGGSTKVSEFDKFTNESWEAAKASGKPIFIDFTANWCVKCKVIEKEVFEDPRFIGATQDIVLLKVDHSTGVDPKYIEETTKMFGVRGLPHMVIAKPGGDISLTFNELHSVAELEEFFVKAGVTK